MTANDVISAIRAFGGSLHVDGGELRYRGPKLPVGAPIRAEITRNKTELMALCVNRRIKPIETIYKGYRFRSRLEARWAVYFDALGVEWEYEPQGFDLGDAGRYLPDFWLKTVGMWAEVKADTLSDAESVKCVALALDSGYPVLTLVGTPAWRAYYGYQGCDDAQAECFGATSHFPHAIWIDYHLTPEYLSERRFFACGDLPEEPDRVTASAIQAARSARFEHGESGPPR